MTPKKIRTRTAAGRLLVLALLVAVIAVFAIIPPVLELDASGTELWYVVGWLVVPLCAGAAAMRAAAISDGFARRAWQQFAFGSFMWTAGTIAWAGYSWVGAALPFPSTVTPARDAVPGARVTSIRWTWPHEAAGSAGVPGVMARARFSA